MESKFGSRGRIDVDSDGPDLVEYALMAAFIVAAAGAIVPEVADRISAFLCQGLSLMLSWLN